MKQLFFTIAFALGVLQANANNTVNTPAVVQQTINVETEVGNVVVILESNEAFDGKYRGRCLDGYTWSFEASSDEEAQKIVNDYCRGPRPDKEGLSLASLLAL